MKYSLCTSAPSPLLLVLNAYGQLLLHDIFLFYFEVRYGSFVSVYIITNVISIADVKTVKSPSQTISTPVPKT